jgi:hypothetical protein
MGLRRSWPRTVVITLALLCTVMVGTAVAVPLLRNGTTLAQTRVVHETTARTTAGTAFVDVPGAATNVTVLSGQRAFILARFSAESACYGGTGYCSVRIMVDNTELDPSVGADFAFDSTDSNRETAGSWESHAIERSSRYLAAGTYRVHVQWRVVGSATLRLDDWTLAAHLVRP